METKNEKQKYQKLTPEEVKHVAELAKLELTDREIEQFTEQLGEVIDFNVNLLNEVDTQNISPLYQVNEELNRTRSDETAPSLPQEKVLKNAPSSHNGFFKVGRIIE